MTTATKEEGMDLVARGREAWIERAVKLIRHVALRRPYVCADDLWALGLEHPGEGRVLGPAMKSAAIRGYIASTPIHILTTQKKSHKAPIRVWRSRLYPRPSRFVETELLSRTAKR